MQKFFSGRIFQWALYAAIPLAVYFINVEVQSYLGRQAVQATGLNRLSLNEGLAKAASENKLVIVDVSAIWCPNCRRLDKQVFSDEAVGRTIKQKYVFVRLEYDSPEGKAFLEKYQSEGFPNLWLLDANGNIVKKLDAIYDPAAFMRQLPN